MSGGQPNTVTCGFCGLEFDADQARSSCQACPTAGACAGVHCPRCGYEMPVDPGWLVRLRAWWRQRKERR